MSLRYKVVDPPKLVPIEMRLPAAHAGSSHETFSVMGLTADSWTPVGAAPLARLSLAHMSSRIWSLEGITTGTSLRVGSPTPGRETGTRTGSAVRGRR
ncbi:MAG: hypothetical protein H0T58_07555 [Gemmatimonadales bacterium]|nr:hypothetical protein [Gemmatimonadales bacterium]